MEWSKDDKKVTITKGELIEERHRWMEIGRRDATKELQKKLLDLLGAFDTFQIEDPD